MRFSFEQIFKTHVYKYLRYEIKFEEEDLKYYRMPPPSFCLFYHLEQ